jgi:hypothetical protein
MSTLERQLLEGVERERQLEIGKEGWAYRSVAELVLDHGRFFAPARWPLDEHPGREGDCFAAAHEWADRTGWTYVEGSVLAPDSLFSVSDHAWCLTPEGEVADPALPDGIAAAYLGVPYTDAFRRSFPERHGDALVTFARNLLLGCNLTVLREGLPADATHRRMM